VALTGTFRINNGIVLAEAAAAGRGVGGVTDLLRRPMIRAGRLRRILADYELPTLGTPRGVSADPACAAQGCGLSSITWCSASAESPTGSGF
jgi:DNA-binding transcriptional LysR family regulator